MKATLICITLFIALATANISTFNEAFPGGDRPLPDPLPSFNDTVPDFVPRVFACPVIAAPPATTNVKNLRPGNIRVVMAIGDSITAGMSAKDNNILNLKEYRGLSFPIGGDTGIVTVPNLLKGSYTSSGYPVGYATGIGKRDSSITGFDGAVSGAHNLDMLSQAQWLLSQVKNHKNVDYNNDWKILSVFIGSNDLCVVCSDPIPHDAVNYQNNLIDALDYLYTNMPRVFVNIIANIDVTELYNFKSGACILHGYECSCGGSSDASKRNRVTIATKAYHDAAYKVASYFNGRNSTGFAVVVQPFLQTTHVPDRSFLSPADCFHPSAKGHEAMSIGLWNNMITPAAQKKKVWDTVDAPICATADTLLYVN